MGNVKVADNSKYQLQTHPKQSVWMGLVQELGY